MKPYVICHMVASVDGRILTDRWHPPSPDPDVFERLHEELGCDAWLVGRVTGQEFAARDTPYPPAAGDAPGRGPWFARREVGAWGVVLDAAGKIAWGRGEIGGDPLLVILTEAVPDSHLAGLRRDGVSYLFAGERAIDLAATLETLNRELGVGRLLLEGGGGANGALLGAGLVDELSLVITPSVDGAPGSPGVFDLPGGPGALRQTAASSGCATASRGGAPGWRGRTPPSRRARVAHGSSIAEWPGAPPATTEAEGGHRADHQE